MQAFTYRNGELFGEDVPLSRIAEEVGTPVYCYSQGALEARYRAYVTAFAGQRASICYALKANSNQAVIRTFADLGCGADVVSEGELRRALAAGVPARRIVFSGVGKTRAEMAHALRAGIMQFNVESEPELIQLSEVAASLGLRADIAIRINPDVDAGTHAKISTGKAENKFGVPWTGARAIFAQAAKLAGIRPVGIAVHIGSQLTSLAPFEAAFRRVVELALALRQDGIDITRLDLGGGLGVVYRDETPPDIGDYAAMVKRVTAPLSCELLLEPGRSFTAEAGVLLAQVLYVKQAESRTFVILDAAMNDLIRPTLYEAWMGIVPLRAPQPDTARIVADFVGPICESGDILALGRETAPLAAGDRVAILTAGAYGAVMASTYNTRLLVPEVLIRGDAHALVRPRQDYSELIGLDRLPDWQIPGQNRGSA